MAKKKAKTKRPTAKKLKRRYRAWTRWPTERLLDVRLCDLGVRIDDSPLRSSIRRIYEELEQRSLRFRPHFWVSEDWFTPAGVPGCAVPFYLLHPRLQRLERSQMLAAEGADQTQCMKLLRHEVGHAIDHAYRLYLRRERQRLFGKTSKRYPDSYLPRPYSRKYVQNIDYWYAQAHPDEDFAETFAVWLRPRFNWRKVYDGWPAMKKLQYVDELMKEIADQPPPVRTRKYVDPINTIRKSLRQYYAEKQSHYVGEYPNVYDSDLLRLFSAAPKYRRNETAASFLRRVGPQIRRTVTQWTGHYAYSMDQVLQEVIGRCRELRLRITRPPEKMKTDATIMLTVITMNFLYSGRRWINL